MSRVNLLPDSYIAHERRRRAMYGSAGALAVVVVVGVVWGAIAYNQIQSLGDRIETAQSRLAHEKDRSQALEANRATMESLRGMLAHRTQLAAPVPPPGVLALLTHLLPESVAVTRLSMDLPPADLTDRSPKRGDVTVQPPANYVPTRVEMEGLALSDIELAKVVGSLASHKAFTNVKLVRSRQVTTAGLTRFAFQITLDVPPALPPTAAKPVARTAEKGSRGA
jgi:Tfp pilus assembly protein PilN